MQSRYLAAASALLLAACTAKPQPEPASYPPGELSSIPAELVVHQLPLSFTAAGGRQLPVPLVEVDIAGKKTLFIVDTGASHHALTKSFQETLGIKAVGTSSGAGHSGKKFQASVLPGLTIKIAQEKFLLTEVVAVKGPPVFKALGIGGFLSPQRLGGKCQVFDFPNKILKIHRGLPSPCISIDRESQKRVKLSWINNKPFTRLSLVGKPEILAEIDTGGSNTELEANYLGDSSELQKCGAGVGVGGCIDGTDIKGQTLHLGKQKLSPNKLTLVKEIDHGAGPDEKGLLGMNLLRNCKVSFQPMVGKWVEFDCKQ